MILLSAEPGLKAEEIAGIVRESAVTLLTWLKRYLAEGIEGLQDAPRAGRNTTVTEEFRKCLLENVRRRPRSLGLAFSMWTLQRLADYLAEKTGIRVSDETIRRELAKEDIVFSRPQHTISSPDPEYQIKKRRLKKLEIWRLFRREVTHCELFLTLRDLISASYDFFTRYHQVPDQTLSLIGAIPK